MVVEDELIVATNIENQLRKIGYEVIPVVDSGEEAIIRAQETKPDLVLMDIKLSGKMDGIEAAQYLYEHFNIPVVYLTAYLDNETLQRAKITSPYGYILKPFEINKLHTTLEIALHKNEMEKMLRESERRFRTLADYSPVGIFQTDINGNCIYMNQRWYEITGLSPAETGGDWKNAIHPEDRPTVEEAWDKMAHSDEKFAMEYRCQTPGGKINWVFGHAGPLKNDPGENTGYIGIITDITASKKLENKLQMAEKLESIGILAGGIAHDFNNLLSVIVGNISMLKNDININQDQAGMLNSIEKAAFQAADLAQKLITFAKGVWLHRDKIIFSQFIKQVIRENFPRQEAFFDIRLPQDLLPIDGDPGQLKQVFGNLLLNAVEAKGDSKLIVITAQNIAAAPEYTPLKKGRYVEISIIDRGVGITQEHLSKIFDPYFSTKPRGIGKGIGLGLTICYSIIQKHDGHIHIYSKPGEGTTVKVLLPIYRVESTSISEQPHAPSSPATSAASVTPAIPALNVLIMDDEPVVLNVIEKLIERMGYNGRTYAEGRQTWEAYHKAWQMGQPFDVVILDLINKKGLGGKETLKKILHLNPKAKVITICGFSDGTDRDELLAEGFSEVLLKPFNMDDLKSALDRLRPSGNE